MSSKPDEHYIIDLCDTDVYPNGTGEHFEKKIYFDIYKHPKPSLSFEYLFLGTNKRNYETVQKYIHQYPDHGILVYEKSNYINSKYNNLFVPTENLLGIFKTFVYTKSTFDPAPRIIQECKYFDKGLIYSRDKKITDGGSVYWGREINPIDANPILRAIEGLRQNNWLSKYFFK